VARGTKYRCIVGLGIVGLSVALEACAHAPDHAEVGRDATGRLQCPTKGFLRAFTPEIPLPTIERREYRGVILPQAAAPAMLCQCSRETLGLADSYWAPSKTQIAELEERLPQFLSNNPPMGRPDYWLRQPPHRFIRMYLGVVRADRPRIAVQFVFAKREIADLSRITVGTVCDGGPRFFGVEYDVNDGNFVLISYNGAG
jgi:hypothetical protein